MAAPLLQESNEPEPKQPYRVYLAPHRGEPLTGPLGWLAKKYDLDVHGPIRLGRRAGKEMGYIAVLLTVIFLFDLAAWWVLWNTIFHSGTLTVTLALTPLSFVLGFIFSMATFIYERQFMTADTSGGWRKLWQPVLIRFFVIFVAAAVTTQPVEVVVFHGPIQRRIHEESIRIEAAHRLTELDKAQRLATNINELKGTAEIENKETAETQARGAQDEMHRLEVKRDQLRSNINGAEVALNVARRNRANARTQRQRDSWSRRAAALESRISNLRGQLSEVEIELGVKSKAADSANTTAREARDKVAALQQAARDQVTRLHDWIIQLSNSEPGTVVLETTDRSDPWTFRDQTYDFFGRLAVLNDIYHGRPARWVHTTLEDRNRLAVEYGLKDIAQDDHESIQRLLNDASLFRFSYWAVVCIAIVIPFLSLAFKRLLPDELKDYYSSRGQWEAGNYEARKYSHVDKEPTTISIRRHNEIGPQSDFD